MEPLVRNVPLVVGYTVAIMVNCHKEHPIDANMAPIRLDGHGPGCLVLVSQAVSINVLSGKVE